jgi:hypothetical protein
MIFYWVLFLIPACVALIENKKEIDPRTGSYDISFDIGIFFWMLFITLAIGLRHGVGGDWLNYVIIYYDVIGVGFNDLLVCC